MMIDNAYFVQEANRQYDKYLLDTGRRDVPGQKQAFLDGYITGVRRCFEFMELLSKAQYVKKTMKGEKYGKKTRTRARGCKC